MWVERHFITTATPLRLASEYFDTMLSSALQEGTEGVMNFNDRDPKEWCMVYQFIDPSLEQSAKITKSNVEMFVPWFHEFRMIH